MRKIHVTGMSGAGKSSALADLGRLGFRVVDTDVDCWSKWSDAEGGYVGREDRMTQLLARDDGPSLYVSGTVSNQGRFYDRFDAVVLLSAPAEVLLSRIQNRRQTPMARARNSGHWSCATWSTSNRFCGEPAPTNSTPPSVSRTPSTNSPNSVESVPLRSRTGSRRYLSRPARNRRCESGWGYTPIALICGRFGR